MSKLHFFLVSCGFFLKHWTILICFSFQYILFSIRVLIYERRLVQKIVFVLKFSINSIRITVEWAIPSHWKLTQTENAQSAVRTIPSLNRWIYRDEPQTCMRSEFHELPLSTNESLTQISWQYTKRNKPNRILLTLFYLCHKREKLFWLLLWKFARNTNQDIRYRCSPSNRFSLWKTFAKTFKMMVHLYVWYSIHLKWLFNGTVFEWAGVNGFFLNMSKGPGA